MYGNMARRPPGGWCKLCGNPGRYSLTIRHPVNGGGQMFHLCDACYRRRNWHQEVLTKLENEAKPIPPRKD